MLGDERYLAIPFPWMGQRKGGMSLCLLVQDSDLWQEAHGIPQLSALISKPAGDGSLPSGSLNFL